MPIASKVMIGFGVLLIAGAVAGWTSSDGAIRSGVAVGLAMLAAGAAAAQGRTSLRKTGYFIGMFLPVLSAGYYGWRAIDYWKTLAGTAPRPFPAILLSVMAITGLFCVLVLMKLRTGDNIAERGYSILPLQSHPTQAPQSPQPRQPVDR